MAFFIPSSILGLVGQRFPFQVLRHLIFFNETPVTGVTHGAISLGLKRDFIGPQLIYGEKENWVFSATWLGPAYMDFGLFGILITMVGLSLLLHLLQKKANNPSGDHKFEVLYIVVLGRMLVLYEEGADLPVIIFLIAIAYVLSGKNNFSQNGSTNKRFNQFNQRKTHNFLVLVTIMIFSLAMISCAFDLEFRKSKTVFQREISTDHSSNVFKSSLKTRYYHMELLGSKIARNLYGKLIITQADKSIREFDIDGVFWLAKKDVVNIGWFKPPEASQYTFTLSNIDGKTDRIIFRIKEASSLSYFIPTYRLVQFGVIGIFISAGLGVLFNIPTNHLKQPHNKW